MIHVERGDAPSDFFQYAASWMEEFEGENAQFSTSMFWTKVRKRRRMKHYAKAIFNAFKGKCAFCESKMSHVSPANIDHYRPKGDDRFVHLMFDWNNWLLSCGTCNTSKGDKFPECNGLPCLIDPTQEQPSEHIEFFGVQIAYKTIQGYKTVKLVNLWRSDLEEQRRIWLSTIDALLLLLKIPDARDKARMYLIWAIQDSAPYTAMTRCYLSEINSDFVRKQHQKVSMDEPVRQIRKLADSYRDEIEILL